MRLLHYPPQTPALDDDGRIIGIGAHTECVDCPYFLPSLILSFFRFLQLRGKPLVRNVRIIYMPSILLRFSAVFYDLVARCRGWAAGAECGREVDRCSPHPGHLRD
jgi:hypothetical protein